MSGETPTGLTVDQAGPSAPVAARQNELAPSRRFDMLGRPSRRCDQAAVEGSNGRSGGLARPLVRRVSSDLVRRDLSIGGQVSKKRGFFAELQRQSAQAQRRKLQEANAAARAQAAAQRQHEAALRQAERARAQAARASAAEQKAAEREAARLHEEARRAEVAAMNAQLAAQYDDIDSILQWALDVDNFVDLEQLRKVPTHPPFGRQDLETAIPPPDPLQASPEPQFVEPSAPTGLFRRAKRHEAALDEAKSAFVAQHAAWEAEVAQLPAKQFQQVQEHAQREQQRMALLAETRAQYEAECQAREAEVARNNADLDDLIQRLAAGEEQAIQEYVAMVLGNSIYPDCFPIKHEYTFDSELRELSLAVTVPQPSAVPSIKEYKYVKAKDEITSASLTQREQKDRYSGAIHQVALRTLHEIFEADRDRKIQTIAAVVRADAINPATGRPQSFDLLAVGADRESFESFDLSNVVPSETLRHLKASVSKSPFDLVPIDDSKGVRG